ncbi:MAG: PadR family transcriptional regulator [Tissierellia bacterium]|nr:PadR family transcriptional regulator [Tissierellia bacterium]
MNIQFKKGVLELCVLSLLNEKDRYGYELVEEISNHIEISEGTIYPMLRRFRNEGYVRTYLEESSSGPPRKYYEITQEGAMFYVAQRREWEEFVTTVNDLLRRKMQ